MCGKEVPLKLGNVERHSGGKKGGVDCGVGVLKSSWEQKDEIKHCNYSPHVVENVLFLEILSSQ